MNIIENLTEEYIHQKAAILDRHLIKFLAEEGLVGDGTVDEIKNNLEKAGMEIIQSVEKTLTQEVYTFKICRVYKKTQLVIPNPVITTLTPPITQ